MVDEVWPRCGDNFELVWDARGWHADELPGRLVAVMLVVLINERRCGDGQE